MSGDLDMYTHNTVKGTKMFVGGIIFAVSLKVDNTCDDQQQLPYWVNAVSFHIFAVTLLDVMAQKFRRFREVGTLFQQKQFSCFLFCEVSSGVATNAQNSGLLHGPHQRLHPHHILHRPRAWRRLVNIDQNIFEVKYLHFLSSNRSYWTFGTCCTSAILSSVLLLLVLWERMLLKLLNYVALLARIQEKREKLNKKRY